MTNDFGFDHGNSFEGGDDFDLLADDSELGLLGDLEDISMKEAKNLENGNVTRNHFFPTEEQNFDMSVSSLPPHLRMIGNNTSDSMNVLQENIKPNPVSNPIQIPNATIATSNHETNSTSFEIMRSETSTSLKPDVSALRFSEIPKKKSSTAVKKSVAPKKAPTNTNTKKKTSQKGKNVRQHPTSAEEEKPKKRTKVSEPANPKIDYVMDFPQKPHTLAMHDRYYENQFLINGYDLSRYPSEVSYIPQKKDRVYLFRKGYDEWFKQLFHDQVTLWDKLYLSPYFKDEKWPFEGIDVIEAKIVDVKHEAKRTSAMVKETLNDQFSVSIVYLKMIDVGSKLPFEMKYSELVGQVEWILHKPLVLASLRRFKEIDIALKRGEKPKDSVKYDGVPANGIIQRINCTSDSSNIDLNIKDLWASLTLRFDDESEDTVSPWELDSTNIIFQDEFKKFYKFLSDETRQYAISSLTSILQDPTIQLPLLSQSNHIHPYPLTIHTIIQRLSHMFYTSKSSFLFDIKHLSNLLKIERNNTPQVLSNSIGKTLKIIKSIRKMMKEKKGEKEMPTTEQVSTLPPHLQRIPKITLHATTPSPVLTEVQKTNSNGVGADDQMDTTFEFPIQAPVDKVAPTKTKKEKKKKVKSDSNSENKVKKEKKEKKDKKEKKERKDKKEKEKKEKKDKKKNKITKQSDSSVDSYSDNVTTPKITIRLEPKSDISQFDSVDNNLPPHLSASVVRLRTSDSKPRASRLKSLAPTPVIPPHLALRTQRIDPYISEEKTASPYLQSYNHFIENVQTPKKVIPPRFRQQFNEKRLKVEQIARKNVKPETISTTIASYLGENASRSDVPDIQSLHQKRRSEPKRFIGFTNQIESTPQPEPDSKFNDIPFQWFEKAPSPTISNNPFSDIIDTNSQSRIEKVWKSLREKQTLPPPIEVSSVEDEQLNVERSHKAMTGQIPVCIPIQRNLAYLEVSLPIHSTTTQLIHKVNDITKSYTGTQLENNILDSSQYTVIAQPSTLQIIDTTIDVCHYVLQVKNLQQYLIEASVKIMPEVKRLLQALPRHIAEMEHVFRSTDRIFKSQHLEADRNFLETYGFLSQFMWNHCGFFYFLNQERLHIFGVPGMKFIIRF